MNSRQETAYLQSIKNDKYALGAAANKGHSSEYRSRAVSMIKDELYLKNLLERATYYDVMFYARLSIAFMHCRNIPPYPEDLKKRNVVLRITKEQRIMLGNLMMGHGTMLIKNPDAPHHRIISGNACTKLGERIRAKAVDNSFSMMGFQSKEKLNLEELLLLNYVVNSQLVNCEMDMKGQEERYRELQKASRLIEPHLKVGYGEEKL